MRKEKIEYFVNVLKETQKLSTCISKQVGCLIVRDGRILLSSYNGVASGMKHCNKRFNKYFDRDKHHEWSNENELHSEQNIISYAAKKGIKLENSIMYVTLSPCIHCSKLILASGIKEVYYLESYDMDDSGIKFLNEREIKCIKIYPKTSVLN